MELQDAAVGVKHEASSSEEFQALPRRRSDRPTSPGDPSPPLLAVDGKGQGDVERVVVLDQGRVLVVEDQLLERGVQVVGLGEAKAAAGLVDDAVFDLTVHAERQKSEISTGRRDKRRHRKRSVHDGAGVAARFAAVPNQEGSVSLSTQQRLGLSAVDVSQTPQMLVVVRKVLLILHHAVLAAHRSDSMTQNSQYPGYSPAAPPCGQTDYLALNKS